MNKGGTMPPKIIFESDTIIEAGFDLVKSEGFDKLTIRAIACRLECSLALFYSNFKSIDDIELLLVEKATKLLLKYQTTERTDYPLLNMGLGYVLFAKDYNFLFRKLFISNNAFSKNQKKLRFYLIQLLLEKMKNIEILQGLTKHSQSQF